MIIFLMDKNANGPIPTCTTRSKQTISDNHLPANKTSFEWRVAGGQMVVRSYAVWVSTAKYINEMVRLWVQYFMTGIESYNNCVWLKGDT